jgi:hypothetical protein
MVAICVVNYQGREDTLLCLGSLTKLTYPHVRVYLVDQTSGDGTVEVVKERFPDVQITVNSVNNGFTGGNNQAIEQAINDGAFSVLLLNNDTVVEPGMLEPLLVELEKPGVGIVGPLMLYGNDRGEGETVWSAGGKMGTRAESVMLGQGEPASDWAGREPFTVDFVVGCGLLAKTETWKKAGLLSDDYFLYYEDADFCARVRALGLTCVTVPQVRLWHRVSRSTGTDSPLTLYYMRRNALLYLSRHGSRFAIIGTLVDDLRLISVWTFQGKTQKARTVVHAVADFLRCRLGRAPRAL